MTTRNPQSRWRVVLSAALCGSVAALVTVASSANLHAQAPAGQGRGAVPPGEALFTSAQAVAGKAAYEPNCANCHGPSVDDGNSAPPLRGAAFLGKYAGKPASDLFNYVITKMPLGNPGSLGGAEYARIIAYVLQQNGFAIGRKEFASEAAALTSVTIPAPPAPPGGRAGGGGGGLAAGVKLPPAPKKANPLDKITPVTDALLQNPPTGEWLTWRRGFDYQGFSPLKQITKSNVNNLRVAWTWTLSPGTRGDARRLRAARIAELKARRRTPREAETDRPRRGESRSRRRPSLRVAPASLRGMRPAGTFPDSVLLNPDYAAMFWSSGGLLKARNAAIRFSVDGCVENNLDSAVPENGRMMYMCDIEGAASSGICFPTQSSFCSALIIGSAVPSVRAEVASALNSRVREIAIRIKPAASGARKIISRPPMGLRPRRPVPLCPPPNHIAICARKVMAEARVAATELMRISRFLTCPNSCASTAASSSSFINSRIPDVTATEAWVGFRPVAKALGD